MKVDDMTFVDASHVRAFRRNREYRWLKRRGFDGLYFPGECACKVDDLYPCGERCDCKPGVLKPCDCGEHDWHIGPKAALPAAEEGEP